MWLICECGLCASIYGSYFSVQSILGLHSLFCCMQLPENQFKGNLNTSNRMKEAKTEGKKWPNLVFVPSGRKNEAQTPWKNLEGWAICSLHKKCQFLMPANEIRMRYLIPRQRNYQLWLRLLPWPVHNTVCLHDTELKLSEVFFVWYQSFIASWYTGEKKQRLQVPPCVHFRGEGLEWIVKFRGVLGAEIFYETLNMV